MEAERVVGRDGSHELPDEPPPSPIISRYSRWRSAQKRPIGRSFGSVPKGSLSSSCGEQRSMSGSVRRLGDSDNECATHGCAVDSEEHGSRDGCCRDAPGSDRPDQLKRDGADIDEEEELEVDLENERDRSCGRRVSGWASSPTWVKLERSLSRIRSRAVKLSVSWFRALFAAANVTPSSTLVVSDGESRLGNFTSCHIDKYACIARIRESGRLVGSPDGSARGKNRSVDGGAFKAPIARSSSGALDDSTVNEPVWLATDGRLRACRGVARYASRSVSGRRARSSAWSIPGWSRRRYMSAKG